MLSGLFLPVKNNRDISGFIKEMNKYSSSSFKMGVLVFVVLGLISVGVLLSGLTYTEVSGPKGNDHAIDTFLALAAVQEKKMDLIIYGTSGCNPDMGIKDPSQYYELLAPEYEAIVYFDNLPAVVGDPQDLTDIASRTTIQYIPGINKTIGFQPYMFIGSTGPKNVIDWRRYKKHEAVPFIVDFYINSSSDLLGPRSPTVTIFRRNIEDRGNDTSSVSGNLEKRIYYSALTTDKVQNHYQQKTDKFMKRVYNLIVTFTKPVHSTYRKELFLYFMDIHFADVDPPVLVVDYFMHFMDLISTDVPELYESKTIELIMDSHLNTRCVEEYIRKRLAIIESKELTDTFPWHWLQAGMSPATVLSEARHNIVAFTQFQNTLAKLIAQSIARPPYNVSNGQFVKTPGDKSYFELFGEATTQAQEINVVREMLRIELPNDGWFSKDNGPGPTPYGSHYQTRHAAKIVAWEGEALAQGSSNILAGAVRWGTYDTSRYTQPARPYVGSFSRHNNYIEYALDHFDKAEGMEYIVRSFSLSSDDHSTVIPENDKHMIPVYPTSLYTPFGLGDRRCPGEIFSQFVLWKHMKIMRCLKFAYYEPLPGSGKIPLSPLKSGLDNVFVSGYATTDPNCVFA